MFGDTHVPSREPEVPSWVRTRVGGADHAVHVGDYDSADALATVREFAPKLTAVHGNMDPHLDLPSVATLDVEGVRLVVTHGTSPPGGWADRVADVAREHAGGRTAVGVAGHTHGVVDREHDGVRPLNPGSATGADPTTEGTMLTVEVDGDAVDATVRRG